MKLNDLINWVKGTRENCEKVIYNAWQEGNLEAWTFNRGRAEALEDVANMLTKVEQDLTFREVIEAIRGMNCKVCPFFRYCGYPQSGEVRESVCNVNIKEVEEIIQKAKEEKNEKA